MSAVSKGVRLPRGGGSPTRPTPAVVLVAAALLIISTGCAHPKDGGILGADILEGNGDERSDERKLEPFERLHLANGVDVDWVLPDHEEAGPVVTVTTDANLLRHVRTVVEDRTLHVGVDHRAATDLGFRVTVKAPSPSHITITEGSRLHTKGLRPHRNERVLEASVRNGGEWIADDLHAQRLRLELVRGSKARLAGEVPEIRMQASRSATIRAYRLRSRVARVRASTGSRVHACATDRLEGRLSFRSKLVYTCDPDAIDVDVGGSSGLRSAPD